MTEAQSSLLPLAEPAPALAADESRASFDWRPNIVALYQRFNPAKLPEVDRILEKYAGAEEQLHAALHEKYLAPLQSSFQETVLRNGGLGVPVAQFHWES